MVRGTFLHLLSIIGIAAGIQHESSRRSENFGTRMLTSRSDKILQDDFVNEFVGRSKPVIIEWQDDHVLAYPIVNTTSGPATGVTADEAHAFYEIPYAEPPVGALRFQDPQPIKLPLQEINATLNNNLQCHQYYNTCVGTLDDPCHMNEDCLVLNVFVPRRVKLSDQTNTSDKLPVMFYIHGGSFKINAGTDNHLNGKELSNTTNSIVVTTNYRLGALGFLVHKETGKEDISGNQGIKDQRLALEWVQDNIENFGGDKNRVTIFGNSAGAQSVLLHTVSALSADLYSFSIQQSNPHISSRYYPDVEASLRISNRLVNALGCDVNYATERQCLLDASAQNIMDQMPNIEYLTSTEEGAVYLEATFMPVLDGIEFTAQPWDLYREGKWNKDKPAIIGVQTEEMRYVPFYYSKDEEFGEDDFLENNLLLFGEGVAQIVVDKYKEAYPPQDDEDYRVTFAKELSHYYFDCPSRRMARFASNTTSSLLYFYANSHPVLDDLCVLQNDGNKTGCYFAEHSMEIEYVFRTADEDEDYNDDDRSVENEFSIYWGSFARTGNPSDGLEIFLGSFPDWPEYTADSSNGGAEPWQHLHITAPTSIVEHGYKEDICDFWDEINYGMPAWASTEQHTTTGMPARTSTEQQTTEMPVWTSAEQQTTTGIPAWTSTELPTTTGMSVWTSTEQTTTTSGALSINYTRFGIAACLMLKTFCGMVLRF